MRLFASLLFLAFAADALAQPGLELLARMPYDTVTLAGCWHYVDKNGAEYALVGNSKGLSIVDLTDPEQPLERFQVSMPHSNWREVKTWGDYAYVTSEAPNSGLYILDLSHLPDSVDYKVWKGDGLYEGEIVTNHALYIDEGFLYLFGGRVVSDGAVICDLADPWNPKILSQYSSNYVHDGYVRNDTLWAGESFAGQFSVIDVSDKSNPKLLSTQPTPGAFTHNTWLSDDGRTLFTTDEVLNAPLTAFDISDLDNITLLDVYYPSIDPSREVHNVRVLNDFLINPSYGGQLSIVDARHPDNLIETAIAKLGSSLVWDADPYLPSGILIATAKTEGLHIFRPNYRRAAYLTGTVKDASNNQPIFDATVTIMNANAFDQSDFFGKYATGTPQSGLYTIEVEKPGYDLLTLQNVALTSGEETKIDLMLSPIGVLAGEPTDNRRFKVSPSPFTDHIRVDLATTNREIGQNQLRLVGSDGKVIRDLRVNTNQLEINDLSHLPNGMYYLQLVGRADQVVVPVVKD